MRINPSNNLTGAIQITGQASPIDTFGDRRTERLTTPDIVDLSPLSATLARYIGAREQEAIGITEKAVRDIARRVESGEDLTEIQREFSDSKETPNRVKRKLAKLFSGGDLDVTANPLFVAAYRQGQGDIRIAAFRADALSIENVREIAQAGVDARDTSPQQAMISAIREKITGSSLYEGMDAFGTAAINARLLDVTAEIMSEADKEYRTAIRQGVYEQNGASIMLDASVWQGAVTSGNILVRQDALRRIGEHISLMENTGDPDARAVATQNIITVARDLAQRDPENAAEFLEEIRDGLAIGPAAYYGQDPDGRVRLTAAASSIRDTARERARRDHAERNIRRDEVKDELDSKYALRLLQAEISGVRQLRVAVDEAVAEAQEGITTPEDQVALREWAQETISKGVSTARTFGADSEMAQLIEREIRTGTLEDATRYLRLYGRDIGTEDNMRLQEALEARRAAPWVSNMNEVQGIENRLGKILEASGAFSYEGQLTENSDYLTARLSATRAFHTALDEYIASPEFADAPPARQQGLVRQFVHGFQADFQANNAPPSTPFRRVEEPVSAAVQTTLDVQRIAAAQVDRNAPVMLGGLLPEHQPPLLKRATELLAGQIPTRTGIYERAGNRNLLGDRRPSRLRTTWNILDVALQSGELKDTNGQAIPKYAVEQAVTEALAYMGTFSLNDLTQRQVTPERANAIFGDGDPEEGKFHWQQIGKLLERPLDLTGADPMRIPILDVAKLHQYVTVAREGNRPTFTMRVPDSHTTTIEKLRDYLDSFNLSTSDEAVGAFIFHQSRLIYAP